MIDVNAHIQDLRIDLRCAYVDYMNGLGPRCIDMERRIQTSDGELSIRATVTGEVATGVNVRTDLRLNGKRISRRDAELLVG